jgi:hypothetical protein
MSFLFRLHKRKRPQCAGVCKYVQALSSRIPSVRTVAVASNLYKSHACLHRNFNLTHDLTQCLFDEFPRMQPSLSNKSFKNNNLTLFWYLMGT